VKNSEATQKAWLTPKRYKEANRNYIKAQNIMICFETLFLALFMSEVKDFGLRANGKNVI
jgi:hypothetical protein